MEMCEKGRSQKKQCGQSQTGEKGYTGNVKKEVLSNFHRLIRKENRCNRWWDDCRAAY